MRRRQRGNNMEYNNISASARNHLFCFVYQLHIPSSSFQNEKKKLCAQNKNKNLESFGGAWRTYLRTLVHCTGDGIRWKFIRYTHIRCDDIESNANSKNKKNYSRRDQVVFSIFFSFYFAHCRPSRWCFPREKMNNTRTSSSQWHETTTTTTLSAAATQRANEVDNVEMYYSREHCRRWMEFYFIFRIDCCYKAQHWKRILCFPSITDRYWPPALSPLLILCDIGSIVFSSSVNIRFIHVSISLFNHRQDTIYCISHY